MVSKIATLKNSYCQESSCKHYFEEMCMLFGMKGEHLISDVACPNFDNGLNTMYMLSDLSQKL